VWPSAVSLFIEPQDVRPRAGKARRSESVMVGVKPNHAAAAAAALGAQRAIAGAPAPSGTDPFSHGRTIRTVYAGPVTGLIAELLLLAAVGGTVGLGRAGWVVGVTCAVITNAALAHGLSRYRIERLGPADWVTLARSTLGVAGAALVANSFDGRPPVTMLVSLAAVALALDAVDGWVARRTGTTGTLGELFDAEVDAFLILVLSVYVARSAGAWVLAIGAARYAFLAAGWALPWMRAPLPPRYWRKFVAAAQGIVLTISAAEVLPRPLTEAVLVVALVLLAESFGRDAWWLWSHRAVTQSAVAAGAGPTLDLGAAPPAHPRRGRARTTVGVVLTIFAFAIVWAALVAPDQPSDLSLTAFMRVPLEGLVLIGLAVVLPATSRRILAGVLGPVLGLVVILKVLDIGFFSIFDRPFDPFGDSSYAGTGIETLRSAMGGTETNLIVVGVVTLAVTLLALTTLSVLRLTRVAAGRRRWSLRAVAGLGVVWALCWVLGAQLVSHSPIASTSAASLVVGKVRTVQADVQDQGIFAKQITHDSFRNTPGDQLLTSLRGKDVLLVFVESYGKVAVQGSSFAPRIDAVLDQGTKRLQTAGFSARSAFVTSPGFGGVSWLAHSSLQSGVWANTQQRYNQLVSTNRFTLSQAFSRAGWRSIADSPADDRDWPQGSSYYHYDKVYDRRELGYRGPTFTYAPMPDQYMYATLQRLELAKTHRRPLFAEVDTVSSHMPWNRIPQMVPWNEVGNGSIFNHVPMDKNLDGAFWITPKRVQAAYARSIKYSLNALISFVQHYGKKNLVMVVVGDEQPLANITGQGASHDVVASVIAHDSAVLKRIGGWGWGAGLRPSPQAPVWPMSAFRNRFLTAFDAHPTNR
jgi:phosphatidylglycerophosphate synthase